MTDIEDKFAFEREAERQGFLRIAGGDEAGRGPLAGPVFAAFVILPQNCGISGIDDSKKLSRPVRRKLYDVIKNEAVAWSIGFATPEEIDAINILEATRLAFKRAFDKFIPKPDFVLLDYIKLPWLDVPHRAMPKGDALSASIGAASILAKEARDRVMEDFDKRFPGYGFAEHKGYGTKEHLEALRKMGPTPIHRRSFEPIKSMLKKTELYNATLF